MVGCLAPSVHLSSYVFTNSFRLLTSEEGVRLNKLVFRIATHPILEVLMNFVEQLTVSVDLRTTPRPQTSREEVHSRERD